MKKDVRHDILSLRILFTFSWSVLLLLCQPKFLLAEAFNLTFDAGYVLEAPDTKPVANGDPRPVLRVPRPDGHFASQELVVDKGTTYKAWIVSDESSAGGSLGLALSPSFRGTSQSLHKKDKIQLHLEEISRIRKGNLDIATPNNGRYVAFDIKLDKTYENPPITTYSTFVIHFQAWQSGGGHPPFAIRVAPSLNKNGPVQFGLFTVDDAGEDRYYTDKSSIWQKEIYSMEVARERWYRLVLFLQPAFNGSGRVGKIGLWVNGAPELTWEGDWGYRPGKKSVSKRNNRLQGEVGNTLHLGVGIYRSIQDRNQIIYIDNVRIGNSFNSVSDE